MMPSDPITFIKWFTIHVSQGVPDFSPASICFVHKITKKSKLTSKRVQKECFDKNTIKIKTHSRKDSEVYIDAVQDTL